MPWDWTNTAASTTRRHDIFRTRGLDCQAQPEAGRAADARMAHGTRTLQAHRARNHRCLPEKTQSRICDAALGAMRRRRRPRGQGARCAPEHCVDDPLDDHLSDLLGRVKPFGQTARLAAGDVEEHGGAVGGLHERRHRRIGRRRVQLHIVSHAPSSLVTRWRKWAETLQVWGPLVRCQSTSAF